MDNYSHATTRKIKIITEEIGDDWKEQLGNESIDAAFTRIIGDDRKSLYCKISNISKDHLKTLVDFHDTNIATFIEMLIEREWSAHQIKMDDATKKLMNEFC